MSQTYSSSFISVNAVGTTVTTGAASAQANIPNDSSGNLPRYIRVAATTESYVKIGSNPTATTNDILVQPSDSVILSVAQGITKIAHIQGTSSGKVNIVPLDNV